MRSCLYRGHVGHRRMTPGHRFEYSTSWFYFDLDEVDQILRSYWTLGSGRFAPASFRREDHLGDASCSLSESVHGLVEEQTGLRLSGPVRLLTQLRHFGVFFSPINMFYCFDEQEQLAAIVAEVSNTPWNQRHCYVLWEGNQMAGEPGRYSHPKEFHVSPFMGMDSVYEWSARAPDEQLHVEIACARDGRRIFQADLQLSRVELSDAQVARCLLRRPVAAAHLLGAIYFQALRLWMKKCQFFPHPQTSPARNSTTSTPSTQTPAKQRLLEEV